MTGIMSDEQCSVKTTRCTAETSTAYSAGLITCKLERKAVRTASIGNSLYTQKMRKKRKRNKKGNAREGAYVDGAMRTIRMLGSHLYSQ
jgi:hypothetical protein